MIGRAVMEISQSGMNVKHAEREHAVSNLKGAIQVMRLLLVALLLAWAVPQAVNSQQPKPERKLLRIAQCKRICSDKPKHTGLDCGKRDDGEPLVMDIPETVYQFLAGDTFNFYIYTDGQMFPEDDQPEGSVVKQTPPCEKPRWTEFRKPAQVELCNPELKPQ